LEKSIKFVAAFADERSSMDPKKTNIILICPKCKAKGKEPYTEHRVELVTWHGKKNQKVTCLSCGKARFMFLKGD